MGLVVLGVVAVLVAAISGVRPHLVTGNGHAPPIPGAPVVGDCVTDPIPGRQLVQDTVTATSGGTVPVYPAQQTRPCTGPRYGEITAVITAPKPATAEGDSDNRYLDDPNLDRCGPAAMQYVGISTQPIDRFWQPYLRIDIAVSQPTPRQVAAGQRWVACIVTLPEPSFESTSATRVPPPPQYASSIRDALHTGRQRDQLGICMTALDWNGDFADSCGQPHTLELFAGGDSGSQVVTRAQVDRTCQQAVHTLTGMPDPTAGGALLVQTHIDGMNGDVSTAGEVPAHSSLACAITTAGGRKLRGSLLALHQQAIPWA